MYAAVVKQYLIKQKTFQCKVFKIMFTVRFENSLDF